MITMRSKLATCSWFILYFGFLINSGYTKSYFDRYSSSSCLTPEGIDARCVDIYQCRPLVDLLKTLRRPHSPAVSKKLLAYQCGENRVCCPPGPIVIDSRTQLNYHNREKAPDVENHKNYMLLPTECGAIDDGSKITKGEDARLNEFPWMALLQYRTSHGLDFLCGGTIINSNYILTAAHCLGLKDAELVSVRVGEYNLHNTTDCEVQMDFKRTVKCNPPVQDLKVEKIISHPQFVVRDKNILNDIALLRVSRIKEAENAYPVCLPVDTLKDKVYSYVFVTGWGLTDSQTKERADILQKVELEVINKRTCAATYSESGIELTNTQICAGGKKGKSSCSGDSGGPMLVADYKENTVFVQHGVVSVGPSYCGIRGYPGVYTMVKFYMDWILDNMEP